MQQSTSSCEPTTEMGAASVTEIDGGILPSRAVVEMVAATENVDQTDLPPLYEAIDPDALDKLFESRSDDRTPMEVTFTYYGHEVTVTPTDVSISEQ